MFKSLLTGFLSLALAGMFLVSDSFAGIAPPINRQCARNYKICLDGCLSQENAAKQAKATCEAAARSAFNISDKGAQARATYDQALKKCRDDYNTAMQSVHSCRQNCYSTYVSCNQNPYYN